MPTKRTVNPLSAKDTSKTAWGNGRIKRIESANPNEQVMYGMSDAVERAVLYGNQIPNFPGGGFEGAPLKQGDPYWTEAYAQSLQLRILFDSLRQLVADLLYRGVCVSITKCGKVMSVPDFADIRNACGDPECKACGQQMWGQSHVEIVGTGKATIGTIEDTAVNFSRFRPGDKPKPFYYPHESDK